MGGGKLKDERRKEKGKRRDTRRMKYRGLMSEVGKY
jgi:hypothetical protein